MAKPKIIKLDPVIRGDTPLLLFPITLNGEAFDLTDWSGFITITTQESPTTNAGALIALQPMTKDPTAGTMEYQTTKTQTEQLVPGTTYYGDVQINKSPVETNNFTVVRFQFDVETDFGVGN